MRYPEKGTRKNKFKIEVPRKGTRKKNNFKNQFTMRENNQKMIDLIQAGSAQLNRADILGQAGLDIIAAHVRKVMAEDILGESKRLEYVKEALLACMLRKEINGYICFAVDRGVYSFQKKVGRVWALIECEQGQLFNGDIDFMIENDLTISAERKKAFQKKWVD